MKPRLSLLLLLLLLGAVTVSTPSVHAQTRQSKNSIKSQIVRLHARLDKARMAYSFAFIEASRYPVFNVKGEVLPNANTDGLAVYGRATGMNEAASSSLGWARTDAVLVVFNHQSDALYQQNYDGICVYKGQFTVGRVVCPGYTPAPPAFFAALNAMEKNGQLVETIQAELSTLLAKQKQNELKAAQARYVREDAVDKVRRESVHRSRMALQQKEAKVTLAKIDGEMARSSNKLATLRSGRERLIALFNKWGELGVPDRKLYERALQMSLQLATLEARAGRMEPALREVAMLLSLDVFGSNHADETTERQLFSISNDEDAPFQVKRTLWMLRSGQTGLVLQESAAVKALADAWFEQLPLYMEKKSSPSKATGQGLAAVSQVLATRLFRMEAKRTLALAQALNRAQVLYGVSAVPVLPQFRNDVMRVNLRSSETDGAGN